MNMLQQCRNCKKFPIANEIELKSRNKIFFYYFVERKTHNRNTCNNVQPSKHREYNDFTREPNHAWNSNFLVRVEEKAHCNYQLYTS